MTNPEIDSEPALAEVAGFEAHGDILTVRFDDGHEMVTRRNTGGWGPIDAIETFSLRLDTLEVAKYQSPYQYPRNTDSRNGFVLLEPGCDQETVTRYWTSADSHIRRLVDEAGGLAELESQDEAAYNAFILLSHGHQDMTDVLTGRAEVSTQ